ncbi:hypothetical protein KP509_28G054000 [Ceratopteris richardii]|nr:hypothetical protein KP509_28G054000 [Ceratopteris richardii]KAH7294045.1 hypothetical protein KP509_28G054000 [Ceratopteris richardii]KAH7294046.1 hypothetical protein KP509_28G054000 [Ceratopteris richardii]
MEKRGCEQKEQSDSLLPSKEAKEVDHIQARIIVFDSTGVDCAADHEPDSTSGSIDFFSADFNPLKALSTKDLAPPNPRVRPLDNLSACRRILPKEVPESIINAPAKAPRSAESILAQERAKAHKSNLLKKAVERERQTKILDKIAEKAKEGPIGLLAECYQKKSKVKVWTRHTHGVRGTLTGFIIAFDKHLNLVLRDIDEEYSVRRWVPRLVRRRGRSCKNQQVEEDLHRQPSLHASVQLPEGTSQSVDSKTDGDNEIDDLTSQMKELRIFPKLEHRRRHLKQVFLRGDSVIIIQKLS